MCTRQWAAAASWLLTGLAMAGLPGAVIYVVAAGSPSWLSLGVILLAIGAASLVMTWDRPSVYVSRPRSMARATVIALVATIVSVNVLIEPGLDDRAIALLWLLTIALFLLAAWCNPIIASLSRIFTLQLRRPRLVTLAIWIGMSAIAFGPRLVWLDRFPAMLDGDEGSFMVLAREAQEGELVGLFGPGFLGNPNLYPAVTGWLASLVGSPPADYRILSGLVGALGVIATWHLGRYLGEGWGAAAGAVILATMPLHLYFSRMALNNITDATVLATALFLLLRSIRTEREGDAALAGVVLGLGLYGYFGARAFPGILLVSLVILTLGRSVRPRAALRLGCWMAGGVIVAAMPLIMEFRANPAEFAGRLNQVSPISRSSLQADPVGTIRLYAENFRDAVIYPFVSNNQGFFRRADPLVGWPVAVLMPIGISGCVVQVIRHRNVPVLACLLVPWVMVLGGVALTVPLQSQRMVALTPLFALSSGIGLVMVARWLGSVGRLGGVPMARVAVAIALVAVGVSEVRWLASDDRQISTYGDYRGMMMWDIGWRAAHAEPSGEAAPAILFAGPPFVFTGGFNNLVIQAPDLEMHDVAEPLDTLERPLTLPEGTVLVIIRERATERCAAEWEYPDATVAEVHARDGELLYVAVYREPLRGWSMEQSPIDSTFEIVTSSTCDAPATTDPVLTIVPTSSRGPRPRPGRPRRLGRARGGMLGVGISGDAGEWPARSGSRLLPCQAPRDLARSARNGWRVG